MVAAEADQLADTILRRWEQSGVPAKLLKASEGSPATGLSPIELDVVCSGGGWRNMYCGGAYSVLRVLELRGHVVVRRAAGASSGALAAATIGSNAGSAEGGATGAATADGRVATGNNVIPCRDWYRLHDAWDIIYQRHGFGSRICIQNDEFCI